MPGNLNDELLCSITGLLLIDGSYTSTEELVASWQRKHNPVFRRRILEQWPAKKDKA
jgi:hypothetical protein